VTRDTEKERQKVNTASKNPRRERERVRVREITHTSREKRGTKIEVWREGRNK
jgi:hypothetical protein